MKDNMINYKENNINLKFKTNQKVFSPKAIDIGTLSMLSLIEFSHDDKILDLGCGYGFVGIYISQFVNPQQITMSDVSEDAILLAKLNAELNNVSNINIIRSNGLNEISDTGFNLILTNPPYHEDFSVPKNFIEKGYKKLVYGGKMYIVTKRKEWYKRKLISVFGGTKIVEINGYYVFMSEKKEYIKKDKNEKEKKLSKKLSRKYNREKL